MASIAHRHDGGALGGTFGHSQSSTGDGICCALVYRDSLGLRKTHGPDDGGVGRVDFDDLDASPKRCRLEARGGFAAGKRGEQPRLLVVDGLQLRLLLLKVERLDHQHLARGLRLDGKADGGVADERLHLIQRLAVGDQSDAPGPTRLPNRSVSATAR